MIRKTLLSLVALIVLAIAIGAAGLTWAHVAIRRERAPLPGRAAVLAAPDSTDVPVRVAYINTASQAMPRSSVLDAGKDPRPAEPYIMSHPAFVLEWADGRILLIDVGMNRTGALDFGKPIETLGGGQPIQPLTSAAERLGAARARVQGIIFTHLHLDHVGGLPDLCRDLGHPVRVFQTDAQAERPNYTTRSGLRLVRETAGVEQVALTGGPLFPVPGFAGVGVIAAGGHTPGSEIVVAHVSSGEGMKTFVFTGDIVNNIDGVAHDIPKPFLYRLLMVPEDGGRQGELRHFLHDLQAGGATLLVSHDQRQLEASGIASW